jgi:hypothetical protein
MVHNNAVAIDPERSGPDDTAVKHVGRMMANRFEVGTNKAITALAGLMRA